MKKRALGLAILAVTSTSVMAMETVELAVTGIIQPTACTPVFSSGNMIDYGVIIAADLAEKDYTTLSFKGVPLIITCTAPTKAGMSLVARRPNTVVSDYAEANGFALAPIPLARSQFPIATGLGLDVSGNKIGGMAMNIQQDEITVDGTNNFDLLDARNGSWEKKDDAATLVPSTTALPGFTVAAKGMLVPAAFTTFISHIEVQAYLNKAENLDLTDILGLDGLVSFELTYL